MEKKIICTVCPRGCHITVNGDGSAVSSIDGYGCKRGISYGEAEYSNPVRILTTTVKIEGKDNDLLPVRSSQPISKEKIFDCMEIIKKAQVKLPIQIHQIIIKDICGTGVDIVATKKVI